MLAPMSRQSSESEQPPLTTSPAFRSVELFAGAGGLALGLEKAGFECLMLNEWDKNACATLSANRPEWNVVCGDVKDVDFSGLRGQVDLLTGGFPCQALRGPAAELCTTW